MSVTRPPFDPELALTLVAIRDRLPPTATPEMVQPMRDAPPPVGIDEVLAGRPITRRDHIIAGYEGGSIVAYASGLGAAGSQAELHVWPGGFHACDQLAPNARLSRDMTAARDDWMARLLGS